MKKDFLKKASTDFALTIGATVVLVGTLQLLVYPFLAWKLDGDRYGLFLVAIGIVNALERRSGAPCAIRGLFATNAMRKPE